MGRDQEGKRPANPALTAAPLVGAKETSAASWYVLAALIVGVGVLVVLAHWPVLSAGAVSFDDDQYLATGSPILSPSWASARRIFGEVLNPSTMYGYYHPLTLISLMLDVAAGGRGDYLAPFHRTNLALHVLNTALVIVLLYLLFRRPWAAALAGLLFAVHPVTVEPVAWLAERKTLLATFFALWSLVFYVAYAGGGRRVLYGACLAAYVLALLSKPTTTPLPVLMLLLDFWPLRRLGQRAILEKLPLLVLGGLSGGISMISHGRTDAISLGNECTPAQIPLMIGHLAVFYLGKVVWPANLCPVYPPPSPLSLSNPVVVGSLAGACLLLVALAISLRRTRGLLTGWLFFFVAISPTLGIVGYSWVTASDKYMYLPLVGFLLPLTWFLGWCWDRGPAGKRPTAPQAATVAVVLVLAGAEALAVQRCLLQWHDTETLFGHTVALAPNSPQARNAYGIALRRNGKVPEAAEQFAQALRIQPRYPQAQTNMAMLLEEEGRLDAAVVHYEEAAKMGLTSARAQTAIGAAMAQQGRLDEALTHLNQAIRLDAECVDAHVFAANVLAVQGRIDDAITHYAAALRIAPDFAQARHNLGLALVRKGRLDDAARQFREVLRIAPRSVGTYLALGEVLAAQGKTSEAAAQYREALRIEPGNATARAKLDALPAAQNGGGK